MQVNPLDTRTAPTPTAVPVVRVTAGSIAGLPAGEAVRATVVRVTPGEAELSVNGQSVTVRPGTGLQTGAVLLVRAANTPVPSLDVLGQPGPAARLAVVDVLAQAPDGRLAVRIDGQESVASSAEPLVAGGRYVLQVEAAPTGLTLTATPESAGQGDAVAAAVLRGSEAPDLGPSVGALRSELSGLDDAHPAVRDAAAAVRDAVRSFLPEGDRTATAGELRALVEDGGLHYEAKLARSDTAAAPTDLKGGLLQLLQAAKDLGHGALPAAQATLNGIEAQQAANVLAQSGGAPYVLQVPFPDGAGGWQTLHLSLEPERPARQAPDEAPGGFRMLLHVPLTELGDTWVEAGLSAGRLRAVVYLDDPAARNHVRAELPALRDGLLDTGLTEVLLDVRPATALPARARRQGELMQAGRPDAGSVLDVRA